MATMTQGPAPTPQKIHAVLKAAGLRRSETHSTRIKGWSHWSAGYRLDVQKNTEYICRYCGGRGSHRIVDGRMNNSCTGANRGWYQESTPTGRIDVEYTAGDGGSYGHTPEVQARLQREEQDAMRRIGEAIVAAGFKAERIVPMKGTFGREYWQVTAGEVEVQPQRPIGRTSDGRLRNFRLMKLDTLLEVQTSLYEEDPRDEVAISVVDEMVTKRMAEWKAETERLAAQYR